MLRAGPNRNFRGRVYEKNPNFDCKLYQYTLQYIEGSYEGTDDGAKEVFYIQVNNNSTL